MATTPKQVLINQLSQFDIKTLSRLVDLGDKIITPDEQQLTSVTFEQIVDRGHILAQQYFPEWNDFSKADFGEFLLELFAYFSEKDLWYLNAFANEGFLRRASLYNTVYAHCIRLGYQPRLREPAKLVASVTFEPSNVATIYNEGELVIGSSTLNTDIVFSNIQKITIPANANPFTMNVQFGHGRYQTLSGDFNGKSVRINVNNVCPDYVIHSVNGVEWTKRVSFQNSNSTDQHYMILPEIDSSIEIVYGVNSFGLRPTIGDTVITKFLVGGGRGANAFPPGSFDRVLSSLPARPASSAISINTSEGGYDQEGVSDINGLEEMRQNASMFFRTQGRIVNADDCKIILETYDEVKQAKAFTWGNYLYFTYHPKVGSQATQAMLDATALKIEPIKVASYILVPAQTAYIDLAPSAGGMELTVYIQYPASRATKQQEVLDLLQSISDPNQEAVYGGSFILGEITNKIKAEITNVQNVTWQKVKGLTGNPPLDVYLNPLEIFKAINPANVVINMIGGTP
jgi:hypothetical protein